MKPDHGVWYGIAFDMVLFGGLALFFSIRARLQRAKRSQGLRKDPEYVRRLLARMRRMAKPTSVLVPAQELGFSKLGGAPELPDDGVRPVGGYRFLAQIDLSELRIQGGPDWLPPEGRLYTFVNENRNGFADLVLVLYSTSAVGTDPAAPPAGVNSFPERRVAFETYPSMPSLDWLGVDLAAVDVSPKELDALADLPDSALGNELQHRIGGYPSELQDEPMAITCELIRRGLPSGYGETEITPAIARASKQWRLLLQVDSDPALGMNWGDGGRLYVFIREKDARTGDFSRTVTIFQTY